MREFSVVLLVLSALVPVILAYKDSDRIYQLPFLYSMAVLVYILPTLFGVINDSAVISDADYIRYCLFSTVCFWSALIGYYSFYNNSKIKRVTVYAYDIDKWSRFLYVIMFSGFIAVAVLGSYDQTDRYGGAYAVLLYPARCLRPATIMLLVLYLLKPSKDRLAFLILSLLFSLKIIIIDGRRSEVFNLFITIAFPLFFIKGIKMPKAFIAPAIVGAIVVFIFLPAYRNYSLKGDFSSVATLSPTALLQSYVAGGSTNEVIEAARNMEAADNSGKYNYGSTVYNVFVFQYAASSFFGKEFKESLLIPQNLDLQKLRDKTAKYGGDEYRNYLAPTGFAAVFFEFGYAGCLLFFFFGYLAKKYYVRANLKSDISALIFYCFFATFILFSIYDSMMYIPTNIILYLLVFWGAKKYSRKRNTTLIANQV